MTNATALRLACDRGLEAVADSDSLEEIVDGMEVALRCLAYGIGVASVEAGDTDAEAEARIAEWVRVLEGMGPRA